MRSYIFAIATAGLFAIPTSAFSQGVEFGPGGVRIEPGHRAPYYHGRYVSRGECRELRRACLYKEELGEEGRGNCRRYRALCQ